MEGPQEVKLADLPVEIWERVLSHLDVKHHKLLREVSDELEDISNSYVLHRYKCYELAHQKSPKNKRDYKARVVLQVIRYVVSYFTDKDYESHIVLSLLTLQGEEYAVRAQLKKFLVNFLFRLESPLNDFTAEGKKQLQLRRLHYTMALIRLLRQFRNFRIIGIGMPLLHWILEIELDNTLFGTIEEVKQSESQRRVYFMVIIAELLFYEMRHKTCSREMDTDGTMYNYGILSESTATRTPRLQIKFEVQGPQSVINLLHDVTTGTDDPSKPFNMPPESVFTANITVKSFRGPNYLYNGDFHINILKLSDLYE
ncbi:uncharacterized protein [Drosophila takahashii]|uniref:uncharacterized protein n=1 Tax=Drosophila takahashii TaxID=29030 RepID=UPI001CF81949|nr:uncharacterized protein LOC108066716 [Drosophila takahashii]